MDFKLQYLSRSRDTHYELENKTLDFWS